MIGKKIYKGEDGQSIIEFALILPILLLILMGILEFGLMLNAYLSINNASRDGARYASVGSTDDSVVAAIENVLPMIDPLDVSVNISPLYGSRNRGDAVTVEVLYTYEVTMPVISAIISNSIDLRAETTMRVE